MPIINNNKVYLLREDEGISQRTWREGWAWNKTELPDFDNRQYWFIEAHNRGVFTDELFRKVIPENIIDSIKNGEISLLVHNYQEGFRHILDPLYKLLICDWGIDEDNIILLTGARDIIDELKQVAKSHNKKEIKVYWNLEFEFYLGIREQRNLNKPTPNTSYSFNKKYLNLNRRWKPHRLAIVSYLIINDLIDDGYVSLIESEYEGNNWNLQWRSLLTTYPTLASWFKTNRQKITLATPLTVDTTSLDKNPPWYQPELNHLYKDSYFSIVNETHFRNDQTRFFSEKTFKPISHYHPFILAAPPNSLICLKERGYKTFAPFINEEYDTIIDDTDRLLAICEEVKRLCNLTETELQKFVDQTREICEHNYQTFLNHASSGIYSRLLN